MIDEDSSSIEQEEMNIRSNEDIIHQCFSKFKITRNYIGTFFTNQYLRIKIWKHNLILKSKDGNICNRKIERNN